MHKEDKLNDAVDAASDAAVADAPLAEDVVDHVPPVPAAILYENITIADVDNDGKDDPTGINGIPWDEMHVIFALFAADFQ